jgi:serine/threonine protein kinase
VSLNRKEPPFKPGDKFQKFEFRRLLGAGGQGFVYEGYDEFLDHVVAIKFIPTSTKRASDIRQRAQMEARILFRLHHPNVVQFFGAEVTERGMVFIVMEMLQGRSLRAVLTELKQLQVDEALLIGTQIAEGMQAAHEN